MLCELCHKDEAKRAIIHKTDDGERELYVCPACAERHADEVVKQDSPEGGSEEGGREDEERDALMKMASDVAQSIAGAFKAIGDKIHASKTCETYCLDDVDQNFVFCGALHLKALDMLGMLRHAVSALHAVGLIPVMLDLDEMRCLGSSFKIGYREGDEELARRMVKELVAQEGFARVRLREERPLLIEDAAARTVSLLKGCRLMSRAELVDAFSMLKLVGNYLKMPWLPAAFIKLRTATLQDAIERQRKNGRDDSWTDFDSELCASDMNRRFAKMQLDRITFKY